MWGQVLRQGISGTLFERFKEAVEHLSYEGGLLRLSSGIRRHRIGWATMQILGTSRGGCQSYTTGMDRVYI